MDKRRGALLFALIVLSFMFVFVLLGNGQATATVNEDQSIAVFCIINQGSPVAILNDEKEVRTLAAHRTDAEKWMNNRFNDDGLNELAFIITLNADEISIAPVLRI